MMGADKEATDIWLFGKPRPDLSAQETFAEAERRHKAVDAYLDQRSAEWLKTGEPAAHIERAKRLAKEGLDR